MRNMAIGALLATALGVSACATYYGEGYGRGGGYGGYGYDGRDYQRLGNDCGFFAGSGGRRLDPWLACTREGQGIVRYGFDEDQDRRLTGKTADRANIWFRRHADTNRNMRLTDPEIRAALVNGARHLDRRR
jgi:opacity protein-like surface antigen